MGRFYSLIIQQVGAWIKSVSIVGVVFFFGLPGSVQAQKQLVLFKNGQIKARFAEGQYIRMVLKKRHRYAEGHIIELNDFSMITSNDTIKFKDILKIDIRRQRGKSTVNVLGNFLFAGGVLYIGLDRANNLIGYNNTQLSNTVWVPSAILAGAGAVMMLIHPHYARVNGINYLQTIDYKSPFFR
ncbi:MAG: hypothetical protein OJF59_000388 [Cytophagales bacterium]|nr:hypothetical protein [Bacteroidota bacterium]WHZ06635.1 MAG: hypothetical protein OJF59_000388 [Cytophagales bacterium]